MYANAVRALLFLAAIAVATGEIHKFKAELNGGNQVPSVNSPFKGTANFDFNTETNQLSGIVEHDVTTPDVAHIHVGKKGENGPVEFELVGSDPVGSFALPATNLTKAQVDALHGDLYYVNIHTAENPGGEIRGQVTQDGDDGDTTTILIVCGAVAAAAIVIGIVGVIYFKKRKANLPDRAGKGEYKQQQDFT
jgi:hypothetical protein